MPYGMLTTTTLTSKKVIIIFSVYLINISSFASRFVDFYKLLGFRGFRWMDYSACETVPWNNYAMWSRSYACWVWYHPNKVRWNSFLMSHKICHYSTEYVCATLKLPVDTSQILCVCLILILFHYLIPRSGCELDKHRALECRSCRSGMSADSHQAVVLH